MMQGFVVLYDAPKHFGFIRIDPRVADLFFDGRHVLGESVRRADEVEFYLDDHPKGRGLIAVDVKRITSLARPGSGTTL